MERLVKSLKMYWQLNSVQLIVYGISMMLFTLLTNGFLDYVESTFGNDFRSASGSEISIELIDDSVIMLLFGILVGGLSIFLFIYGIYLLLRPFTKKQIQHILLLGQSAYDYICAHVISIILLNVVFVAAARIFLTTFFQDTAYGISGIDVFFQLVIDGLGINMWVLTIPLLLQNGKLLNKLTYTKKKTLIISGVIGSWVILNIAVIIYNLRINFELYLSEVQNNIVSVQNSNTITHLGAAINILGIILCVWAVISYRKNYQMDI
jgi:hypothetical protein